MTKILVSNWWSQLASLPGLFRGSISPSQTGHAGRPWLCCWCNGELGLGDLSGGTVLATAVALQHSQPTQHIPTRKFHEALQYENACGFDSKWFYQVHWHTLGTTGHSNKEHPSDVILSETDLNSTMVLCQLRNYGEQKHSPATNSYDHGNAWLNVASAAWQHIVYIYRCH